MTVFHTSIDRPDRDNEFLATRLLVNRDSGISILTSNSNLGCQPVKYFSELKLEFSLQGRD